LKNLLQEKETKSTKDERKDEKSDSASVEEVFQSKLNELKKQNKALIQKFEEYYEIMNTFKGIIFENS
jgi:hypothetical protein